MMILNPHYPPLGQRVSRGWHTAAHGLPDGPLVLAPDGPTRDRFLLPMAIALLFAERRC